MVKKTWLPRLGEPSDQPAEIAVRLGGEEQLRLLDREDDARGLGRAGLEPAHESDARRRARASASRINACTASADGEPTVAETRSPPRSAVGKCTIGGPEARSSSETVRPSARVASIEIARWPTRHVSRRQVEARVEEGAQGEEQVRLAGARLADERANRAGPKHQPARAAEIDDTDLAEQRVMHRASLFLTSHLEEPDPEAGRGPLNR